MVSTWHTNHFSDLEKFYKFVWAVHRYCRPGKNVKKSKKRLRSIQKFDWQLSKQGETLSMRKHLKIRLATFQASITTYWISPIRQTSLTTSWKRRTFCDITAN